jgi:hypothetical protein
MVLPQKPQRLETRLHVPSHRRIHTMQVVKPFIAVDGDSNQEFVLAEITGPFFIQRHPVGLNRMQHLDAGFQ